MPKEPKEPKPLPAPLVWSALLTICWGGVFFAISIARLIQTVMMLIDLANTNLPDERELEFTRGATIALVVFYSLLVLLTLPSFIGGILVLRRSNFGATIATYSPGVVAVVSLVATIAIFFFIRGSRSFLLYLLNFMMAFVLGLALAIFNGFVMNDRKNAKVLR